jgi:hypothetical protein
MTSVTDALSSGLKQFAGFLARIASATCLSVGSDCFGKSERVGELLLEYRMQKLDEEIQRRFIIMVKDHLVMRARRLNVVHGMSL